MLPTPVCKVSGWQTSGGWGVLGRLTDSSDRQQYQAWFRFNETTCPGPNEPIKPRRKIPISFNRFFALAQCGKAPTDSSVVWMRSSRALFFLMPSSSSCPPLLLPGTAGPPQALLPQDRCSGLCLEKPRTPGKMWLAQPMEEEETIPVYVEHFTHTQS